MKNKEKFNILEDIDITLFDRPYDPPYIGTMLIHEKSTRRLLKEHAYEQDPSGIGAVSCLMKWLEEEYEEPED